MTRVDSILYELRTLGSEQTQKTYLRHGAKEPLFGVTTGALKTLAKKVGKNHALALLLFETGNYDAMNFAGMIAQPKEMTQAEIEGWMKQAYCHGIADYVVAVTLAETDFAAEVADRWIGREEELYASAGWSCYAWLLGVKPDTFFKQERIEVFLGKVRREIHQSPNWVRYAMNTFLIAVGLNYKPLHQQALEIAGEVGRVSVDMGQTQCEVPNAKAVIEKAAQAGRIGFKRRNVRC